MPYNEITRVQVPALMHLAKLGYNFISQKDKPKLDATTNVLTDSFTQAFNQLNPNKNAQETLNGMKKRLNYDDLGKSFYEYLLKSEHQIIDFNNPNNNRYEMMAELPYKSLRPDITLFINGLPLVNIEVKQPYAEKGIKEERDRHIQRYKNPENKVFYNLTQIWLFSDNLPYDDTNPNQGAFYGASYSPIFQRFVEANKLDITPPPENDQNDQNHQKHRSLEEIQKRILNEFNLKDADTLESPKDATTNPFLTSFCSHKRLCFILKYGISFLQEKSEFKKHVWRYAQMFASLNVLKELQKHYETNPKDPLKGIIWHTQGSGKTALTYHLTKLIRDFFSPLNKKTKFYFVVCFSSAQAKKANEFFNKVQEEVLQNHPNLSILNKLKSDLILHDEPEVKEKIHSFKHEDTDIVFVFNMLLTGFDLPNLKRLYIHRKLDKHNLLQALARVNRPYNNMSFGYLIDFVGIEENFDKTTDDYLKELNAFNLNSSNQDDANDIKNIFADPKILEKRH